MITRTALLLGILFLICNSCNLSNSVRYNANHSNTAYNVVVDAFSDYYLSNRSKDCEESIKFMKSIIEPNTSLVEGNYIRFIQFSIKGETNPKKLENLEKLFIDIECLKNLDKFELFKLLCSEQAYRILEAEFLDPNNVVKRYFFECIISNMNCFTIIVKNGVVRSASWCIQRTTN